MGLLAEGQVREAAELLRQRRLDRTTMAELPASVRPDNFEDGYRIQLALHELLSPSADGSAVGSVPLLKVGCTTLVTQEMLNVDEPIGGRLVSEQLFETGSTIPIRRFHHQPLIECEFAFRVAKPIVAGAFEVAGDPIGLDTVQASVDAVAPALELVDNRFELQIGVDGPSVVADNSMAAAVVLGAPRLLGHEIDGASLAETTVQLTTETAGGVEIVAEGVGRDVLGDPWQSLLWAVNHEQRLGRSIAPGTWVITGSCAGAPPVPLDQLARARFDGLGDVTVTISTTD